MTARVNLASVPLPRLVATTVVRATSEGDGLLLGFEVSAANAALPIVEADIVIPWRWPRPWRVDVCLPPRYGRRDLVFEWSEPRP